MRRLLGLRAATVCGISACLAATAVAGPASAAGESITAHVATAHPTVGKELDIAGQVTGASTYPATVTVTRDDSAGTSTPVGMPVTTDDQGNFTAQDTPPARGEVTYHLSADANAASTDVAATVAGKPTALSVHAHPSPADAQSSVHVVAYLGSATSNRDVTIYARPYRRARQAIDQGPVDANGARATDHTVVRRTTFIARFAGDSAYAPATARVTLRVRPVLDEALKGYFRTSRGVRIYHRDDNPNVPVHMLPEHKGSCLYFRAQHRSHGQWVRSAVSPCKRTDSTGRLIGVLQGVHIVGVPYRLRVEWHGNKALARRNGAWLRLEFR